jgi:hypothetical protein
MKVPNPAPSRTVLTTQIPGLMFPSSNLAISPSIYMIPYLSSLFADLRLLIHAPDLFCNVTFPLILPSLSGLQTLRDSYVPLTFDFSLPIPFYLFPDFNLLPNDTLVFDFSEIHVLTSSFIQLSATAELLRIQMYNSNVTLAYDSHPYQHTPKFRRPSRWMRTPLDNEDPFRPHHRQPFRDKTSHPRKRHEQQPRFFFNTNGEAWSL